MYGLEIDTMYKTEKRTAFGHEYTCVVIDANRWGSLFDWAEQTIPRAPGLPHPHSSWFAVPTPHGVIFYFYEEEEATVFLLKVPLPSTT